MTRLKHPDILYVKNGFTYHVLPSEWRWAQSYHDFENASYKRAFDYGRVWGFDRYRDRDPYVEKHWNGPHGWRAFSQLTGHCKYCQRDLPIIPAYFKPQPVNTTYRHDMMCRACANLNWMLERSTKKFIAPRVCPCCNNEYPFTARYWPSPWDHNVRETYKLDDNTIMCWNCFETYKEQHKKRGSHVHHANRRARLVAAPGSGITTADIDMMRKSQTDKRGRVLCWICGKPMLPDDQTLEHWIPLDKGGAHDPGNCHLAHGRCNSSKGAKHPTEIGRLI